MRAPLLALALLAPALLFALAPAPAAADPLPLSSLPAKPARYTQAAGPVPVTVTVSQDRYSISTEEPDCLMADVPKYWIDGDGFLEGHWSHVTTYARELFWIERFVVRDGAAELERIRASIVDGVPVPSARSRIPLHAVAQLPGLVVYAYRWDAKVYLVARSLPAALVRTDNRTDLVEGHPCGLVYTELIVRRGSSQAAQIRGRVPSTGKTYLVDASISQTSRDPEPLLSVTARLLAR